MRLTTKAYWDARYRPVVRPRRAVADPRRSYFADEFLRVIDPHLRNATGERPVRLLEMGCGNSTWLPYFAVNRNYRVAGVDYSEQGCRMAEANLAATGSAGQIYCCDFNNLRAEFMASYDVVLSLGVVEHFDNTAEIVGRFAACLAPGGLIITLVPNMTGAMGYLQKVVDHKVYAFHVPLDKDLLAQSHVANGLTVRTAAYFGFLDLSMINISRLPLQRLLGKGLGAMERLHATLRRLSNVRPQSESWSSFVVVVAEKAN